MRNEAAAREALEIVAQVKKAWKADERKLCRVMSVQMGR